MLHITCRGCRTGLTCTVRFGRYGTPCQHRHPNPPSSKGRLGRSAAISGAEPATLVLAGGARGPERAGSTPSPLRRIGPKTRETWAQDCDGPLPPGTQPRPMHRSLEPPASQLHPARGWERDEGQTILSGDGAGDQISYPLPRSSRIPSAPHISRTGPVG